MLATSTNSSNESEITKRLIESMRWFCRSLELCDDFLRGYYGLKLVVTSLILHIVGKKMPILTKIAMKVSERLLQDETDYGKASDNESLSPPSRQEVEKLNELATAKLGEIVRKSSTGEQGWTGFDEGEVIAARELLDRHANKVER